MLVSKFLDLRSALEIVSTLLSVPAAVLAILVVRRITAAYDRLGQTTP